MQLAVLCDNSRSTETIPSDQSDFNRYGGLYRHVNLVYAPALSLERVLVDTRVASGSATVSVTARLFNPTALSGDLRIETRVIDPAGKEVHSSEKSLAPWTGAQPIASFAVPDAGAVVAQDAQPLHLRRHAEERARRAPRRRALRPALFRIPQTRRLPV